MPLQAPIDSLTHHTLRAAVLDLRETERRHRFPAVLHVGVPGRCGIHVEGPHRLLDGGLRADLVLALFQQATGLAPRPYVWLTRPGALSLRDGDVPWASAVRWVAAATVQPLSMVVVTRQGWFDPESGVVREWRRLRRHAPRGAPVAQSQV